jgi:hypothetical protein
MKITPYHTILIIVTGFLLLGCFFSLLRELFYWAALAIGLTSLVSVAVRDWIIWGWLRLSHILGWINSKILLSVVFVFFLTPIALLYRLLRKDSFMIRKPPEDSAFTSRNYTFRSSDLENPW